MKSRSYKMMKLRKIQEINYELYKLEKSKSESEFGFLKTDFEIIIKKSTMDLLIKSKKLLEILDIDNEFDMKMLKVVDSIVEKVGVTA